MLQPYTPGPVGPEGLPQAVQPAWFMPEQMEKRPVSELIPYARNARTHSTAQIRQLRASIHEFGFINPILIDRAGNVIAGHGRLLAAEAEGMNEVPCVLINHLSDAQRRAYILADNRLAEMSGWDNDMLAVELGEIQTSGLDLELTGFDSAALDMAASSSDADKAFADGMRAAEAAEEDEEYQSFVDKFKTKKTTDDCYTPKPVYDAVRDWVVARYGLEGRPIVRPFYPGGDYAAMQYPTGCVVIDNPPFSILAKIVDFYLEKKIPFFLFSPALTVLNTSNRDGVCAVIAQAEVVYENGAVVRTSFLTSMDQMKIVVAPDLHTIVEQASYQAQLEAGKVAELPSYTYPMEVATSARLGWLAVHGTGLEISPTECVHIRALDMQKQQGKAIYGCGVLLGHHASDRRAAAEQAAVEQIAAEQAAAEQVSAYVWQLSEREQKIIDGLK